jgi:S1/P1 nuclease
MAVNRNSRCGANCSGIAFVRAGSSRGGLDMKRALLPSIGAACLCIAQPTTSFAWGSQGHQYVGSLAWTLLNPNAQRHVRQLLGPGVDLSHAAVWADCARSVKGSPTTSFAYTPDKYTPAVCADFSTTEQARMVDYASRNWTNCNYRDQPLECHKSFHFADVNVQQHQDYNRSFGSPETEDYDVVQAINAATIVLKCPTGQQCAVPQPFSITSKREALLLLAHFVGDVHQPLHVGAVYLDQNNAPAANPATATAGGNLLLLTPGDDANNLHHEWDTIKKSLGVKPTDQAKAQACQIAPLPNPTPEPPESWAADTILAAQQAYANMTFVPDNKAGYWDVQFVSRPTYLSNERSAQARQLIKGGARLASLLNSIWPSTKVAVPCR